MSEILCARCGKPKSGQYCYWCSDVTGDAEPCRRCTGTGKEPDGLSATGGMGFFILLACQGIIWAVIGFCVRGWLTNPI